MRLRFTRRMLPSLVGLAVVFGVACSEVVTSGDDPNVSEAADPVTSSCSTSISCKNGSASCSASGSGATCGSAFSGGKECKDGAGGSGDDILCCTAGGSALTCNANDDSCRVNCQ